MPGGSRSPYLHQIFFNTCLSQRVLLSYEALQERIYRKKGYFAKKRQSRLFTTHCKSLSLLSSVNKRKVILKHFIMRAVITLVCTTA